MERFLLRCPCGLNGVLYFNGTDYTEQNYELWKSDGTEAGTVRVGDIFPGQLGSDPKYLTVVGNTLFFSATDPEHSTELWKLNTTVVACPITSTWLGNVSTAWENAGNWSNGVPCSTTTVSITAGKPRYPVININTTLKSMTVEAGTSIIVAAGVAIILLGN